MNASKKTGVHPHSTVALIKTRADGGELTHNAQSHKAGERPPQALSHPQTHGASLCCEATALVLPAFLCRETRQLRP